MKKFLIYAILSIVLMVPLVSIIVMALISQQQNTYSEYVISYSYGDLDCQEIVLSDFEEVITCDSVIVGKETVYEKLSCRLSDDVSLVVEIGEFISAGKTVALINGTEYGISTSGKLMSVSETDSGLIFGIQSADQYILEAYLPVDFYSYRGETCAYFTYCGETYELAYASSDDCAGEDGATFAIRYVLPEGEYLYDSVQEVLIKTGRVSKQALSVPQSCIYLSESSGYYLQIYDGGGEVYSVNVELGLMGDTYVEVIPLDDERLKEGMQAVVNDQDVFAEEME